MASGQVREARTVEQVVHLVNRVEEGPVGVVLGACGAHDVEVWRANLRGRVVVVPTFLARADVADGGVLAEAGAAGDAEAGRTVATGADELAAGGEDEQRGRQQVPPRRRGRHGFFLSRGPAGWHL